MLLFLNLGGGEVVIIVIVILLLFGSKSIPDIAKGLGKGIREFKDAANNIQREIQNSASENSETISNPLKEIGQEIKEASNTVQRQIGQVTEVEPEKRGNGEGE